MLSALVQPSHREMGNTLHMASSDNILADIPEYMLTESHKGSSTLGHTTSTVMLLKLSSDYERITSKPSYQKEA